MKKYIFGAAIIITALSACTEVVDIKLPNSDKKIVVEGTIENGKVPQVIITRTIPLFSSVSGTSATDFYVLDAKVYVSNGFITDTLLLTIDSSSALGLVYKGSGSITGIAGQNYSLMVVAADGNIYKATTSIPYPVALDSVWWKPQPPEDTLGFANARLSEPAGLGNNYRWLAKRPKDRRFIAQNGSTFDDKLIDGKSFEFAYIKPYDPTDNVNTQQADSDVERFYYRKTDTIYIKFSSIDRASKEFYTTFESAVSSNGNPFASPTTIIGNLDNGALGVWAGMGVTYDTILPTP